METGKSRFAKRTGSVRPDGFTDAAGNPVKNALLLAIPDREFGLLRPHLEYLELPHHQILQEPGQKIEYAYFLNHGMISLVILTSDGRSVEVAIVGNEGMVGTSLAVGLNRGPHRAIIQISASGFRVKSELLGEVLSRTPELRLIMNRYVLIQGLQVAQMELYRKHGVNPFGSCWFLLLQMPIFMGLYYCLQESVHFRLAGFLWIDNLAAPDMLVWWSENIPLLSRPTDVGSILYLGPYLNLLPIVAVTLMIFQQKKMMPPM